jgi:hypothetical protein
MQALNRTQPTSIVDSTEENFDSIVDDVPEDTVSVDVGHNAVNGSAEIKNEFDDLENAECLGADCDEDPNDYMSIDEIIQKNVSKKVRDFKQFFSSNNFVTEKGDQRTNIINVGEKKTFCIPDTYIEEFFTLADECRKEGRMIHFSERQETSDKDRSGIMIDFDRY